MHIFFLVLRCKSVSNRLSLHETLEKAINNVYPFFFCAKTKSDSRLEVRYILAPMFFQKKMNVCVLIVPHENQSIAVSIHKLRYRNFLCLSTVLSCRVKTDESRGKMKNRQTLGEKKVLRLNCANMHGHDFCFLPDDF